MMRTRAVRAVGGYRPEYDTAEDLDLFLRLAERWRLANLPDVILRYRLHPGSIGHRKYDQQRRTIDAAVRDAHRRRGPPEPAPRDADRAGEVAQMSPYRKWAWWALRAGYVATARKHAARCLVDSPFSFN